MPCECSLLWLLLLLTQRSKLILYQNPRLGPESTVGWGEFAGLQRDQHVDELYDLKVGRPLVMDWPNRAQVERDLAALRLEHEKMVFLDTISTEF